MPSLVGPYRRILALPGTRSFAGAAWVGRFAKATMAIAAVLLVAGETGDYAIAGAVAGAIAISVAVAGPQWSRAVDRLGQRRVLALALPVQVAAALAFVAVVVLGAPAWTWIVLALAVGATAVDLGVLSRARWLATLDDDGDRHTAFSLESVADELAFVLGPPLVTLLATAVWPALGFLTGVGIGVAGALALLPQRATEPPVRTATAEQRPRGRVRGILPPVTVFLAVGLVFGSLDVGVVAFAEERGFAAGSGVALGIFAVGSVIAGVVLGSLTLPGTPSLRLLVAAAAFALLLPTVLLADTIPALIGLSLVAGLSICPVLILGTALVESRSPRERLTELLTWPATGLGLGVTVGSAVAGLLIEHGEARSAFLLTASAAVLAFVFALVGVLWERVVLRGSAEASL
ncbi:MFS transporter [Herbiconiux sp. SYSU D00978]|uniref:MFS transporter n=1 Tax=Herbiconiux sp. SYSU D00978 TaxID=2812562 RepID=UPI001A96C893|nr:MFS transporter [Herbiconiux sp. SYSU D00978]